MDFADPQVRRVFFDVHHGLPREGPGNRACTARALALAGALPERAIVLDVACGPGDVRRAALPSFFLISACAAHKPRS